MTLKSPFVYFGGKRKVADLVWQHFGAVQNFVEPFFGSGAVLLARPTPFDGVETVSDACGFVANAWRALRTDPDAVADWADQPVNENNMHAQHIWLVERKYSLQAKLEGDPDWFDAKAAGWWLFGMACWIGSGYCSGEGPWRAVDMEDGTRQLVHLGDAGRGVNRQLVHLGDAGRGVNRQLVHLGDAGRGVNRKLVHLGGAGRGVNRKRDNHREALFTYFRTLSERLRHVRVCCGDWTRVMGDTVTLAFEPCAIFLDPPYRMDTADGEKSRDATLYRNDGEHVNDLVDDVIAWCAEHGGDKRLRICVCGYDGEGHEALQQLGWECVKGQAGSGHGYGGQSKDGYANKDRERLYFSQGCKRERGLFDA